MTAQTLTLTDFLLARIAERAARVDSIPDWYCTNSARGDSWGSRGDCPLCEKYMFEGTESVTADAFWDHMEEVHRRTLVLKECEALARVVGRLNRQDSAERSGLAQVLLADLAQPYADHPDFRPEWRA